MAIPEIETKFIPWALERQADEVAQLNIGIMPLTLNKWTEGKYRHKTLRLQYGAAGVPPAVSGADLNGDIITHGEEGFVASYEKGFHDDLAALVSDETLRRKPGHNARIKIERNYSVSVVGKQLANLLKTASNESSHSYMSLLKGKA